MSKTKPAGKAASAEGAVKRASLPTAQQRIADPNAKGRVCIVTRKPIKNVTRAPRMAKALVDAGYEVVVVSVARPVPQLEEMCRDVQYFEAYGPAYTVSRRFNLNQRRKKWAAAQAKRMEDDQAILAKGGWRALVVRLRRAAKGSLRPLTALSWRVFVATPCALIFMKTEQGFVETWRQLAKEDRFEIAVRFVMIPHQWAVTHAFADKVNAVTRGKRFDVVQAYDNYALVAGAKLAARDRAKLIYDAVELASRRLATNHSFPEKIRERLERREEAHIFQKADGMLAIGEGLADWYAGHYRIPRPLVVRNCRYYWPFETDTRLRQDAGIGNDVRLLVWCGSLYPQQGIEIMIKVLPHLPPHIHSAIIGFFQPGWKSYVEGLPAFAASLGVADRVHLLPEREPNDLVAYISGADIGVIPAWGERINNLTSMPNKFHEMVMARLPLASSRVGETLDMIRKYAIGCYFDERDLPGMAAVIEGMLVQETYARLRASVMIAAETFAWERESQAYVELVDSLMPAHAKAQAMERRKTASAPPNAAAHV